MKKSNVYFPAKQCMVPLDRELQWVNVNKTKAIQTDLDTFRRNHAYPEIIQAYSKPCPTLAYLCTEPWHIQNLKYIQNPGIFTILVYSEPPYIQNAGILKIRGIFRTLSNIYDKASGENI